MNPFLLNIFLSCFVFFKYVFLNYKLRKKTYIKTKLFPKFYFDFLHFSMKNDTNLVVSPCIALRAAYLPIFSFISKPEQLSAGQRGCRSASCPSLPVRASVQCQLLIDFQGSRIFSLYISQFLEFTDRDPKIKVSCFHGAVVLIMGRARMESRTWNISPGSPQPVEALHVEEGSRICQPKI